MARLVAATLLLIAIAALVQADRNADRITSLPNVDASLLGPQWSGYYTVNKENGRNLHYWFIQAEEPTEHLVLWLNGGPGCSSLDGLLYENGPWLWTGGPDETAFKKSPYSWNRVAHMLYLESPAGVGFSYSDTPSDYYTANDTRTADDAFQFLVQWFADFPEYKNYKFYVAGESFAGIYVPTLADRIVTGNSRGQSNINLVGIAVGNGVTDPVADSDMNNLFPFAYGHALYSTQTQKQVEAHCTHQPNGAACQQLTEEIYSIFGNDILNIYDIYGPCYHQRPLMRHDKLTNKYRLFAPQSEVPCINARKAELWLNRADVKAAIHVRNNLRWEICSTVINENYIHNIASMLPIYTRLLQNSVRVLVYSGDVDASVPFTGSQYWTSRLQVAAPLSLWQPWMNSDNQLAGFETIYPNDFRFVTIRGAGHMTPQFRPEESFIMFSKWLRAENLSARANKQN
jgi:carboxypeptidase C (cathepsin A)